MATQQTLTLSFQVQILISLKKTVGKTDGFFNEIRPVGRMKSPVAMKLP